MLRLATTSRLTAARCLHSSVAALKEVPFLLADIGEGITDVELREWFVSEGDTVEQFDRLCEVQSDKATVEITSRYDGVITKLHYDSGDIALVGKPLVSIDTPDAAADSGAASSDAPAESAAEEAVEEAAAESTPAAVSSGRALATPAVRRLAREKGIDLAAVDGSGKAGRVMKEDVLRAAGASIDEPTRAPSAEPERRAASSAAASPAAGGSAGALSQPAVPVGAVAKEDEVVPIRGLRRIMVKSMTDSLQAPHMGYADEIPVDGMLEFRTRLAGPARRQGLKLTSLPIIMKATSLTLNDFPQLNAHFDVEAGELIQRASHNISLAMDTPEGLVVPVVRDCQAKSLFQITRELGALHIAAREGKLSAEDLKGGTFTLSNIGTIGGTVCAPILVMPQVAIGALGRVKTVPLYDENGTLQPKRVMNVSLVGDHRVVDGATLARFGSKLATYLDSPELMLAHMV